MTVTAHTNPDTYRDNDYVCPSPPSLPSVDDRAHQGSTEADRFIESRIGPDPVPAFRALPPVLQRHVVAGLGRGRLSGLEVARIVEALNG